MQNFLDTTPIGAMTIGDLRDFMRELLSSFYGESDRREKTVHSGHYVYGLRGIQQLFGVSHKTAQEYKDGILKDSVRQNGRKIVVDADLALELFNRRDEK